MRRRASRWDLTTTSRGSSNRGARRGHRTLAAELEAALRRPEVLATGEAGTVYLCHPFLLHAAQMHQGTVPRFLAQPPLTPAEPFRLDREDGSYSPVEIAIRQALQEDRH